jgi:aryl-phospho-beta-D-glucosidase BglC (GH1 family)
MLAMLSKINPLLLTLVLCVFWSVFQPGNSFAENGTFKAPAIEGVLHTNGMEILDAQGNEVVFRGVNVSGMEWGAGSPWGKTCKDPQWGNKFGCYGVPPESMYDNIASWGFNMVRIPISWANIENIQGGPYNEAYLEALDHIVSEFQQRNIAVIFSMHQWAWSPNFFATKPQTGERIHGNGWPVWLYPSTWFTTNPVTGTKRAIPLTSGSDGQQAASREFFLNNRIVNGQKIQDRFIDVWTYIAQRYASYENVIGADIINEPSQNQKTELEQLYLNTGEAIASVNPQFLLIFEKSLSSPNTLNPQFFLQSQDFPTGKAVYSSHLYAGTWDQSGFPIIGKVVLSQELSKIQLWNVPLWIGEFHCIMQGNLVNTKQTGKMLGFMKKEGNMGNGVTDISWSYWAYQKDSQPLAGVNGTGPINWGLVTALQGGF